MKCGSCEQVSQISNQIFFVFRVLYLPIIEYHVNVDTCIYKDNPSFLLERLCHMKMNVVLMNAFSSIMNCMTRMYFKFLNVFYISKYLKLYVDHNRKLPSNKKNYSEIIVLNSDMK